MLFEDIKNNVIINKNYKYKKFYKYKGHSIVEYGRETEFDFNKENEWDYVEALNNKDALADMTLQQERQDWIDDAPYIHHITELPSYQNMNYALARQDRIYTETEDDVNMDDEFFPVLEEREEPDFAGIGTREITQEGIQAIRNVYALTFRGQIENYISLENKSDLFPSSLPLTGVELMALYEQGNSRISEVLDQMEDLTPEERQTYLNEFSQFMTDNEVNTQDKLEEALRKFICNL